MNISKWKKHHDKGIFTGFILRLVKCEEIVNWLFLGGEMGLPLSVLTLDQHHI